MDWYSTNTRKPTGTSFKTIEVKNKKQNYEQESTKEAKYFDTKFRTIRKLAVPSQPFIECLLIGPKHHL